MIRDADGALQRQVGVLFEAGTLVGWDDGALLDRFASGRDDAAEAAFACLVERHGPMVLRVCRAALGDEHEAHDAFQATFLVLARKARTVRVRETIGPWLHGVAWRVSARARAAGMRRRRHERRAAEMAARSFEPAARDDAEAALHEEVRRLPEAFRAVVVLCDLEGLTTEGAAERLGVPVGTARSRLYRGRDRLRGRLLRRGLAPAAVGAVVAVPASAVTATVPAALAEATVRLAVGCAWAGAVPARLAVLMYGGRQVMGVKSLAAVGLSLGLVAGVGGLAAQGTGDGPGARPGAKAEGGPKVATHAPLAGEPKRAENDFDRLQGRWIVRGPHSDPILGGAPAPSAPLAITFRGNRIIESGGEGRSVAFEIEPTRDPKMIRVDGPGGSPIRWIYEWDGDLLRLTRDKEDPTRIPRGLGTPVPERALVRFELVRDPEPPPASASVYARPEAPSSSPTPADEADKARLRGAWKVVRATENGRVIKDDIVGSKLVFGDETYEWVHGSDPKKNERHTYRLDTEARPKGLYTVRTDPDRPQSGWMIYDLEGDGLQIAFHDALKNGRPGGFDPSPGRFVLDLVRVKSPPVGSDFDRLQGRWTVLSVREGGREAARDPKMVLSTMSFRGSEVQIARRDGESVRYIFWIDPDADPRAMLLARAGEAGNERPFWWVYAFDRNKLRIGFDGAAQMGRPRGFESSDPAHPTIVFELIRDPGRPPVAEPRPEEPPPTIEPIAPVSVDEPLPPAAPLQAAGVAVAPPVLPVAARAPAAPAPAPANIEPVAPPAAEPAPMPIDAPPPSPAVLPPPAEVATAPLPVPGTADRPAPSPPEDFRRLQGTWTILAEEEDGRENEPDPDATVLVAGNAIVFVRGEKGHDGQAMSVVTETFALDPTASPSRIELTSTDRDPSKARHGIYRVEGPSLLLCVADPDASQPADFDTKPGSGHRLYVLRRKKPARGAVDAPILPPNMPVIPAAESSSGRQPGSNAPAGTPPAPRRSLPRPSARPAPTPAPSPAPASPAPRIESLPPPRPAAAPSPAPAPRNDAPPSTTAGEAGP